MKATRDPMTQFGVDVTVFCACYGITKKQLAAEANIKYDTLIKAIRGHKPGHKAQIAIRQVIERYEASTKKQRGKGGAAI